MFSSDHLLWNILLEDVYSKFKLIENLQGFPSTTSGRTNCRDDLLWVTKRRSNACSRYWACEYISLPAPYNGRTESGGKIRFMMYPVKDVVSLKSRASICQVPKRQSPEEVFLVEDCKDLLAPFLRGERWDLRGVALFNLTVWWNGRHARLRNVCRKA